MTELSTEDSCNRLRRLRILQRLREAWPSPVGETGLLFYLRGDPELSPTIELIRRSLVYLRDHQLVKLITVNGVEWMAAQLTDDGISWLLSPGDHGLEIYSPAEKPEPSTQATGNVSTIDLLPVDVRAWLVQALTESGPHKKTYTQLTQVLNEQGYEISRSVVGKFGKKVREEQEQLRKSIEMAKAFAEVVGDDGAAMNQTLTVLAQQELMDVIREGRYSDAIKLPDLVRAIANLNRSDINTKKFQIEQAARKQALNDAADAVEQAAQQKGLSKQDAQFWREQVLGVK